MPRFREIISYPDMVQRESLALQKGMNFRVRGGAAGYSIILMSVRWGAPYQDKWHDENSGGPHAGMLEYEGHDAARTRHSGVDPKSIDQPMRLPSGILTDNGKFYEAAIAAKSGVQQPEQVQVYEKIASGIWCDRGRYLLIDAEIRPVPIGRGKKTRNVFRFFLRPTTTPAAHSQVEEIELSMSRQIPTAVKVKVWKRDNGRCVTCGAIDNLHFDHDVPYSKGGSSITEANVRLLCARHNLQKSDRIVCVGPLFLPLVAEAMSLIVQGA